MSEELKFNLSEKGLELEEPYGRIVYPEVCVREFIRLNKQLSRKIKGEDGDWINVKTMEELAGDKLSK